MEYCTNKSKARVNFKFASQHEDNVISLNTPVNVEVTTSTPGGSGSTEFGKCWRFTGQGVNNDYFYEYFACGLTPSFDESGGDTGIYMDGARLGGSEYVYRAGTYSVAEVSSVNRNLALISNGDCDNCLKNVCSITIDDTSGTLLNKLGNCPVTFKVYCDEECPSGHIKCKTTGYPGYCCIPCKDIAQRINNLAARL